MSDTLPGSTLPATSLDAALEAAAEDWRTIAFSSEPTDRTAAEAAVAALYDLVAPGSRPEIRWYASPAEAARSIVAGGAEFAVPLRGAVRDQPWEADRAELLAALGMADFARAWQASCAALAPEMSRLAGRIAAGVEAEAADGADHVALRIALTHALHGQHDAAWLPLFDAVWRTAGIPDPAGTPVLAAVADVARHAGWWWAFQDVVILTDRPTELHRDELGRLHRGGGPALAYADGFALHSWRGQPITAEFSAKMAAPSAAVIREEPNAELRRMLLEHFTYERFVAESGATPVQDDEAGRLWRIELPDDEAIVMVEVVNASPEPDGTFNTYWLRVPPTTRTAKGGVAWTFGMTEDEYQPLIQT
jgi:hypothetical protein